MSNLVKSKSIIYRPDGTVMIDSNHMVNELIKQQNAMRTNPMNPDRKPDADGFVQGLEATMVEQLISDDTDALADPADEAVSMQSQAILEDAQAQADEILQKAQAEAERLLEEARQMGYQQGLEEAQAQVNQMLADKERELDQSFEARKQELEEQNREYRAAIEPALVDTLMNVYTQVTRAIADDKKDMIYFLVDNVLRNAEMSKDFVIRVSEEDYRFLENNKEKLYGANNPDIRIDIVKDSSFERNQCVIETDSGVFDCSLDIQLDNLRESIHLLSCVQE